MKTRIIFFTITLIIITTLFGQRTSQTKLLDQIRQESFDLAVLEEEVKYYQQLIDKQKQIKKLHEQDRLGAIREMFERDLSELEVVFEADDTERAIQKLWEINHIYKNITELDISNYFPEKRMLYYEARMDVIDGKYKKAQKILEKLLAENLDPSNRNKIVLLLEEIYFNLGNYRDLTAVYPLYRGLSSVRQRWWLGHSLYNTGKLDEASTVFRRLAGDKEYDLRARYMSVLITYSQGNIEKAVNDFLTLKYRYDPQEPYYNLINLALARLYAITGKTEEAINLYDQYVQLESEISDDVLYEIATIYKQFGEYAQAIKYYQKITEKAEKSKYYVSAKYFTAITEQDRGNYESGQQRLREVIEQNESLMLSLNEKYALLESYSNLLHELTNETLLPERRAGIDGQLSELETQFGRNREQIEAYSEGLDQDKLLYLKLLEEEYFSYTITLANYEAFVHYSRNPMLKRLPSVKNYEMTHTDSSVVYLQMVKYVEGLGDKTAESYLRAKFLAEQKVYLSFVRDIWFDIMHIGLEYNSDEIKEIAIQADSLINQNINIISDMEDWAFKDDLSTDEKTRAKQNENLIRGNNKEVEKLEKTFIQNFSKYITPILALRLDDFAASQDKIKDHYVETITEMVESLSNENNMYENTLLDILLRQTKLLDQEYVEFREKVNNENNNQE